MDTTRARVQLDHPITVDGTPCSSIALRKPGVGELRGLKMIDVYQMDVDAMLKLLPRISEPALSPQQVLALDPADFARLSAEAMLFFVGSAGTAAVSPTTSTS